MQIFNPFYYKNKNLKIKSFRDNIESHDHMSTFFSNTDTATLREEGLASNHFVSLIVNNAGTYTAGITRLVKSKKTITDVYSYNTFEGKEINETKIYDIETEEIEWYELDITVEKDTSFNDLDTRLDEIKKIKEAKTKTNKVKNTGYQGSYSNVPMYKGCFTTYGQKLQSVEVPTSSANNIIKSIQTELPFDKPEETSFDIPYDYVHFDSEVIKSLMLQLITGSIIIPNESKINVFKWAAGMKALYDKRFGEGKEGMKLFKLWADSYIEFICWNTFDDALIAQGYDDEELAAICANDLMEAMKDLPRNKYLDVFDDILLGYII